MKAVGALIGARRWGRRRGIRGLLQLPLSEFADGETAGIAQYKHGPNRTDASLDPFVPPSQARMKRGVCSALQAPGPRSDVLSLIQLNHNGLSDDRSRGGFRKCHSSASAGRSQIAGEWTFHDSQAFSQYYRRRPFQVLYRAVILMAEIILLGIGHLSEKDIQKRAEKLGRTLIRLGAFYIKLGQALSTRPDILPIAYCQELAKLQDHVPPFPTSVALESLEAELGAPATKLYAYITPEPVAAASLGQVYKAQLHSGQLVAVKVQRPGVTARLALDAHLLRLMGGPLQRFAGARSDLIAMINEMVERMFEEVDYVHEGKYAERFNSLYGITQDNDSKPGAWHGLKRVSLRVSESSMEGVVKVPKVYWELTSRGVLTMEWVDGIKLTDAAALANANLDTQLLVDQGVFCSLRQLLEEGFFHADPHPGNLVVTKDGVLAYFDFGMMSEIRKEYRIGLIRTIVHFVNRDSLGLAKDFVLLGFIPNDVEIAPIAEALRLTFGLEGARRRLDFQGIMAQLSAVMYQFQFRLPSEYALVIRALGSLEGTATVLDPDFKVVASAYPFIVGRLLADPDPAMREILRELLIRNNGSIRWQRLERLVFAIAGQTTSDGEDDTKAKAWRAQDELGQKPASGSFNPRAVASAATDVFNYILSGKGLRTRTFLVQDITQTFDRLLRQAIARSIDVQEVFKEASIVTAANVVEGRDLPPNLGTSPEQTYSPLDWSQYTSVSYWGSVVGKRFLGDELWQTIEGRQVDPNTGMSMEQGGVGERSGSATDKNNPSSSGPDVDDFASRLKVGFQAFANAVNSAPEVWIPVMTRLASKPEARTLAADILSSLGDVYCNRTSEASFLFLSRALHKRGTSCQETSEADPPEHNKA